MAEAKGQAGRKGRAMGDGENEDMKKKIRLETLAEVREAVLTLKETPFTLTEVLNLLRAHYERIEND